MTDPIGGPAPMPEAELAVDLGFVRDLLDRQFPEYADRPLELVANGWDNVVVRIGDDLAARVPRRSIAVDLVEHEVAWLPTLAPRLPIPVPAPVRHGHADDAIPWPWSVVRWIDGDPADASSPPDADAVRQLAAVLRALAVPAPADAPHNPFRGVPLPERDDRVRAALDRVRHPEGDRLLAIWEDALAAPVYAGPPAWNHGDLHPANLVTRSGRLAGVIDWGDLNAGDPAGDLQVAWTWLDAPGRALLFSELGSDPDAIRRACGNAVAHGLAVLASSADSPRMARIGHWTIDQVLLDHPA